MELTAQHKIESHMVDSYYWVGGRDINSKAMGLLSPSTHNDSFVDTVRLCYCHNEKCNEYNNDVNAKLTSLCLCSCHDQVPL